MPSLTATVYARDSRDATSAAATAHVTVGDGDGDGAVPVARGMRVKAEAGYGLLVSHGLLTLSLTYARGDDMRLYGLDLSYEVGAFSWTYRWRREGVASLEQVTRFERGI